MAKPVGPLNMTALAGALKCSETSVKTWTANGMPRRKDLSYDLPDVVAWLRAKDVTAAKASFKKAPAGGLEDERARLAKEQADKLELENAITRGEHVHIEVIAKVLEEIVAAIRPKLLGLASFLAPRVYGCNKLPEVSAIIDEKANEILLDLAAIHTRGVGQAEPVDPDAAEAVPAAPEADRKRVGRPKQKTVVGKRGRSRSVGNRKG